VLTHVSRYDLLLCLGRSSPVNTRRFSLFPFSGLPLKKPFCQPFVNFTMAGWHFTQGVKTLRVKPER